MSQLFVLVQIVNVLFVVAPLGEKTMTFVTAGINSISPVPTQELHT